MSSAIEQLKDLLGDKLCAPEEVKAPEGVATGLKELDSFLIWHGIPKGALSLFRGALGTGATSLWIEAAARTVNAGKWVAWVNNTVALSPLPLAQKGVNLDHFVSIQPDVHAHGSGDAASQDKKRSAHTFFILQELLSSSIFELVGCDLGTSQLKEHQLRKLQAQARNANIALVLISQNSNVARGLASDRRRSLVYRGSAAAIFSLILQFEKKHLTVERALHRQTPHRVQRSLSYARFTNFANAAAATLTGDSGGNTLTGNGLHEIEHARA